MSIKLGWFVVSETSILDIHTNTMSLINCFDQINAVQMPAIIPKLKATVYIYQDKETISNGKFRISIISPSNENIIVIKGDFEMKALQHRIQANINNLQLNEYGLYKFVCELKTLKRFKKVAELPFKVSKLEQNKPVH